MWMRVQCSMHPEHLNDGGIDEGDEGEPYL